MAQAVCTFFTLSAVALIGLVMAFWSRRGQTDQTRIKGEALPNSDQHATGTAVAADAEADARRLHRRY